MILSVVIICYNSTKDIRKCLNSFYFNKGLGNSWEILVLDNSGDGVLDLIKEEYPKVRIVKNNENLGFGKGNNRVIEYARGDYVFLLNPDTEVYGNTFNQVSLFASNGEYNSFGVKTLHRNGEVEPSSLQCFPLFLSELPYIGEILRFFLRMKFNKNKIFPRSIISGAALIIKRDLWNTLNGFDESFFMYSEEVDLCYRIKKETGMRPYMVPSDGVFHYVGKSFTDNENRMIAILKGKMHFALKHYSKLGYYLFRGLLEGKLLLKIFISFIKCNNKRKKVFKNVYLARYDWYLGYHN